MSNRAKMVMFPTKYEIYLEGDDSVQAKFNMVDAGVFEVETKAIMNSDELREIAMLLDEAYKINDKGLNNE